MLTAGHYRLLFTFLGLTFSEIYVAKEQIE